jgi:hypothetical protein
MIWYREAHFWSRVDVPASAFDCWAWEKTQTDKGYGQYRIGDKVFLAHRISYELAFGEIPESLEIDHLCRNTICVNPFHLEAVTSQINNLRSRNPTALNAKKTHCTRGHELTETNLHKVKDSNWRICKECVRSRQRKMSVGTATLNPSRKEPC